MEFTTVGSGPSVVLLPGLGCDHRLWDHVTERLSARFRVVLPEIWGRGALAERAQQMGILVQQWGGDPVGLAGLSMGGYLALECLRQWPQAVRAAALLDTTAYADTDERLETRLQVLRLLERGRFAEVLGAFVPSILSPGLPQTHPARTLLLTMAQELGAETFAEDVQAILQRGDFSAVLQRIRVPILFASGSEDTLTPPSIAHRMAAEVPGSRVVEIPGAGHMTPLERPQLTAALLEEFFTDVFFP